MPAQFTEAPEDVEGRLARVQADSLVDVGVVDAEHRGAAALAGQVAHFLVLDEAVVEQFVQHAVDVFVGQDRHAGDVLLLQEALVAEETHHAVMVSTDGVVHDAIGKLELYGLEGFLPVHSVMPFT